MAIPGSTRVSRVRFGVHAETIFVASELRARGKKSPQWQGRHRQHTGRVCSADSIDAAAGIFGKRKS